MNNQHVNEPSFLRLKSSTYLGFGVLVYTFVASLYVCTIIVPPTLLSVINIIFLLYMLSFIYLYKITSIKVSIPLILFWFPILLSIFSASLNLGFYNDNHYYTYYLTQLPVRVVNCLVFILFYILSSTFLINNKNWDFINVMKSYFYGILIFLIFFGCWQVLNMFFGISIPTIETRSYIHSLSEKVDVLNFFRVTSIADEPSYFVPFVIDALLISLFLKKYYITPICILLLLFSISLGGYVNFLLLLIYALYLKRTDFLKKKFALFFLILISVICGVIILFPDVFDTLFNIITDRKEVSDGSYSESARGETVIKPWTFLFEGSPWSVIFGNGPASMKYLNAAKVLSNGDPFHATSNNIVTDYVFETGLLGLFCLFLFFVYLMKEIKKNNYNNSFYSKIFIAHLFISSLYRADYITPRFWILVLIIIYLIKNDNSYSSNLSTS